MARECFGFEAGRLSSRRGGRSRGRRDAADLPGRRGGESLTSDDILVRIRQGLEAAAGVFANFLPGSVQADFKEGHGPVTEADREANRALRAALLRDGEGWLSEESVDDPSRLQKEGVWIVDPLDGTREFIAGIPEWCVSIAWVERGRAVAGGVCNPATQETVLGSLATGVTYNGQRVGTSRRATLRGAVVLASRSEVNRGEWRRFEGSEMLVRPVGSVAYKLALVAAGRAEATWTLCGKHEWDVAAGVALVEAAGGFVVTPDGTSPVFNRNSTRLAGLIAGGSALREAIGQLLAIPAPVADSGSEERH